MSRGDSECSLERPSRIERDTATGETSELGSARIRVREEKRGERSLEDAHRVFVSATCADGSHSLLVTSASKRRVLHSLAQNVPTRKIEERREREEREGRRKGKKDEDRGRAKTQEDSRGQDRESFRRASSLLGLEHSRLRHRRVRSSLLKIARKVAA